MQAVQSINDDKGPEQENDGGLKEEEDATENSRPVRTTRNQNPQYNQTFFKKS